MKKRSAQLTSGGRYYWFPVFAGLGLVAGLLIPSIFEWGEKPAARSRHVEQEIAAVVAFLVAVLLFIAGNYIKSRATNVEVSKRPGQPAQFRVAGLLTVTFLCALFLAIATRLDFAWSAWAVLAVLIGVVGWMVYETDWLIRDRAASLLAGMYCPFFWMILYNVPFGYTSGLVDAMPLAPALIPVALVLRGSLQEFAGVAVLIIALQIGVGAYLAKRGGKIAITYLWFILIFSSLSSFAMHVLYRI